MHAKVVESYVPRSVLIRTSFRSINSERLLNSLPVANERRPEEAYGALLPQWSRRGQRPNTLPEVPTVLNVLVWVCVHQVTVAGCTNLRPKTAT